MAPHKLTDISVRMLKPKSSSFQVSDGGGLYLKVYPNGAKSWLLRKYSAGKQTNIMLGSYPELTLAMARAAALKELQKIQLQTTARTALTMGEVAREWLANKEIRPGTKINCERSLRRLSDYSGLLFDEFTPTMARALIHETIRKHTAHAALHLASTIAQIERYAFFIGATDQTRLQKLSAMIKTPAAQHRRFVTADRLPELCALMHEHATTPRRLAMVGTIKLLMLTLLRCNEAYNLRWEWVDLERGIITIPPEHMKAKREHRVPISAPLAQLLTKLTPAAQGYLVSDRLSHTRNAPARTYNCYFQYLGILPLICPHGVRSMGRTWFAEHDFNFVHCEYCLAHRVENQVQLSYQRSDYLEQRRPVMEAWGQYVESCFSQYFPSPSA